MFRNCEKTASGKTEAKTHSYPSPQGQRGRRELRPLPSPDFMASSVPDQGLSDGGLYSGMLCIRFSSTLVTCSTTDPKMQALGLAAVSAFRSLFCIRRFGCFDLPAAYLLWFIRSWLNDNLSKKNQKKDPCADASK